MSMFNTDKFGKGLVSSPFEFKNDDVEDQRQMWKEPEGYCRTSKVESIRLQTLCRLQ